MTPLNKKKTSVWRDVKSLSLRPKEKPIDFNMGEPRHADSFRSFRTQSCSGLLLKRYLRKVKFTLKVEIGMC